MTSETHFNQSGSSPPMMPAERAPSGSLSEKSMRASVRAVSTQNATSGIASEAHWLATQGFALSLWSPSRKAPTKRAGTRPSEAGGA
jgi:hypothetical protein